VDGSKAVGVIGTVFEDFEVGFRIGVVIGGVGSGMALCDTQIKQQLGHGFGTHRRAAISVQDELIGGNVLFEAAFGNQFFGQPI
jgi:hypothetical protein